MANITPGDWQRIGYWQIANTGNNTIYVSLNAKVVSQSIDNNTSTVATLLNIDVIGSGSYNTSSVKAGLTGGSDISWGYSTITNGKTLIQGQFTCSHASDGTCNAEIGCWVTQTFGGSLGYTSVWVALPTIARASQPSINTYPNNSPNITAGTACTIYMNRKSTSFTHKVTYSIGSASGTIANSGVTDNVSWTPSTNLCAQFPNAKSKSGTITVTTYNGSTTVGTKTCTFNLSIPSGSNPTLSKQTVTEQNSYVKAKGESITLQQISSKSVSVKASAKYSASLSKVTCNGVSLSNSSGTWSGKLNNLNTGTFTFTVTDSRGLTSSVSVSTTYYEYAKPQLTEGDLKREEQTSSIGALTVKGTYKDVLSNTVTMTYERKVNGASEGQSSITPTVSSGSVSYSQSYTDLHYTNSYDVVITITDSFGESATATLHLGVGQYALWLGKAGVILGKDSKIMNSSGVAKLLLDFCHPVGSIYMSTSATSPADLFGGTWEQIKNRFLVGAGDTYGVSSTGGSSTHTHSTSGHTITVKEMPSHLHALNIGCTKSEATGVSGVYNATGPFVNRLLVNDRKDYNGGSTGGSASHSHGNTGSSSTIPPYYATYMWVRTA